MEREVDIDYGLKARKNHKFNLRAALRTLDTSWQVIRTNSMPPRLLQACVDRPREHLSRPAHPTTAHRTINGLDKLTWHRNKI